MYYLLFVYSKHFTYMYFQFNLERVKHNLLIISGVFFLIICFISISFIFTLDIIILTDACFNGLRILYFINKLLLDKEIYPFQNESSISNYLSNLLLSLSRLYY